MTSLYNKEAILKLEKKLNIDFNNKKILQQAITHKSFPNENEHLNLEDNERLEFLGDSVLSLTVSTHIYHKYDDYPEGELAKMRSVIVSAPMLAEKSRELNIGDFLLLGKGEELTGGRQRESILADTMEAILGAIYLEKNFSIVSDFILDLFRKDIDDVARGKYIKDYKTILQEIIQKDGKESPVYSVVEEIGPDHNKTFIIKVNCNGAVLGSGKGSSKKEAEQEAARKALKKLNEL